MKYIINLLFVGLMCACICSCSDLKFGDSFLGSEPESSGADIEAMFSSKVNADKVLTKAYTYLPYGIPTGDGAQNKLGGNILEAITDLYQSFRNNAGDGPINLYYNGLLSANTPGTYGNEDYRFGSEDQYSAIRYAWFYVENAAKIPDISETERNERIAEAKMIIALSYAEMLRYVGGVSWIDHAVSPSETMKFPRISFAETVDKIVDMLDNGVIPFLKWKQSDVDDGHMTKAGAMALKLRVLLFAASPTFNSDTKWRSDANKYTCYGNSNKERWQRAMKAGEDFMTTLASQGIYKLTQSKDDTPAERRLAFRSAYYDRGGTEVLISTRRGYNAHTHNALFDQRYYSGPTLNYVNMFPWADGTDFPADFDWKNPGKQPFFDNNGIPTRDPRLYETVAVPGDHYFNDTPAPVYTNNPNYRPEGTGFLMMKFILQANSDRDDRPTQWPYLRLPEVLLSYAEAINEYKNGPDQTAYDCVNQIRARVGLPALTKLNQTEFRNAVLRERALELGFEEVRWFDLIRWGMKDEFRKPLYGLRTKGDDPVNPTKFTFDTPYEIARRYWADNWDTKWYMAPIPQLELNKDYGMTQNPGW